METVLGEPALTHAQALPGCFFVQTLLCMCLFSLSVPTSFHFFSLLFMSGKLTYGRLGFYEPLLSFCICIFMKHFQQARLSFFLFDVSFLTVLQANIKWPPSVCLSLLKSSYLIKMIFTNYSTRSFQSI